jgi:mannose-6-phosphate isomerase-like protein (cupin superfamily)
MMDTSQYIASGVLEEYCMGLLDNEARAEVHRHVLLYPEIATELNHIELALEQYAQLHAVEPGSHIKQQVMGALGFAAPQPPLDMQHLPLTNAQANHLQWLDALKHLIPAEPAGDFFAVPLQNTAQLAQTLVITKSDVPEETHGDLIESFFILKGECICTVGSETHHLHPGSFLEIPLYTTHDIQIVSPYVVGVLQHRML